MCVIPPFIAGYKNTGKFTIKYGKRKIDSLFIHGKWTKPILKAFEQQLLDYCFSFVTAESRVSDIYDVSALDIIKHFGWGTSGTNYKRIAEAFKRLKSPLQTQA